MPPMCPERAAKVHFEASTVLTTASACRIHARCAMRCDGAEKAWKSAADCIPNDFG